MHRAAVDRISPPEALARLDALTVRYRLPLDPYVSLKETVLRGGGRQYVDCVALDGVDLEVRRGEVVGVIGRNGAGKTTLLKVLGRIVRPSAGRVRLRGRVVTLIDLIGAFHFDLTGRENALMNAALAGLSRADAIGHLPAIEEFAELGAHFNAPMRTWSAGMILRLAFAVATSVDADLLLIDEALGVGDAAFQKKCEARMDRYRDSGAAFVIVSHDLHRLAATADRIVWLQSGKVRMCGAPAEVADAYRKESAG